MLADRDAFLANFEDFASRSLLVKVGDEDAELLLGDSLDAFVERLLSRDPGAVLATAGRDGATLHRAGDRPIHADIVPLPGPVVDTMGAGDATLAAVVRHMVVGGVPTTNRDWAQTLHEAMVIAAATVRHEGALLRMPHHDAEPVLPELSDELGPGRATAQRGLSQSVSRRRGARPSGARPGRPRAGAAQRHPLRDPRCGRASTACPTDPSRGAAA